MILLAAMRYQQQARSLTLHPRSIEDNWKLMRSPAAAVTWTENVIDFA
jgi:hypothetical protein